MDITVCFWIARFIFGASTFVSLSAISDFTQLYSYHHQHNGKSTWEASIPLVAYLRTFQPLTFPCQERPGLPARLREMTTLNQLTYPHTLDLTGKI